MGANLENRKVPKPGENKPIENKKMWPVIYLLCLLLPPTMLFIAGWDARDGTTAGSAIFYTCLVAIVCYVYLQINLHVARKDKGGL